MARVTARIELSSTEADTILDAYAAWQESLDYVNPILETPGKWRESVNHVNRKYRELAHAVALRTVTQLERELRTQRCEDCGSYGLHHCESVTL